MKIKNLIIIILLYAVQKIVPGTIQIKQNSVYIYNIISKKTG